MVESGGWWGVEHVGNWVSGESGGWTNWWRVSERASEAGGWKMRECVSRCQNTY